MFNQIELEKELKIFVFVRDYLMKYNPICYNGIYECNDCGIC